MIASWECISISDNMMKFFKHEMDLTAESLISFLNKQWNLFYLFVVKLFRMLYGKYRRQIQMKMKAFLASFCFSINAVETSPIYLLLFGHKNPCFIGAVTSEVDYVELGQPSLWG